MFKNALKAIIFLLIFAFCFIKISYVLRIQVSEDDTDIPVYINLPKNSVDVVYFGPSSARRYWASMEAYGQFGFTSFNFASSGMPAQIIKYAVTEALKNQSPELLVIDLRPFENAENPEPGTNQIIMHREAYIRNVTDSMYYSLNRLKIIESAVPKENHRLNYHLDIAKYHSNLPALVNKDNWAYAFGKLTDETKETKAFGGYGKFINNHEIIKRTDYSDITEELPLSENLNPIFLELINYCANLDTNVIFIIPPYSEPEENHKKHNYMSRIIAGNGMPFLDCNNIFEQIGMDIETDFYNSSHTNIFGAKRYTKWLGQYLKDNYNLPDRRNDSKYSDWNAAYELWAEESGKSEKATLAKMPREIQAKIREGK